MNPDGDCVKTEVSTSCDAQVENFRVDGAHMKRDINAISMVSVAFNICSSWLAVAVTLAIAIFAGGTFTLIYGIIVAAFAYAAVAISLAELASVYPTAGGQYHFASILAPKRMSRSISYVCGVLSTCSWVFAAAAVTVLVAQILIAIPAFLIDTYVPQTWHYFLVFQALNVALLLYNIFVLRKAPWTHEIGFALSITMFITSTITSLARSHKQPASFVWRNFENNTGWPDGVTFLTGLLTPAAMFLGLDGALHLAEECINPQKVVPIAILSTTAIGATTAFVFAVSLCYGITDIEDALATTMPIYELWRQATRSNGAATAFMCATLTIGLFTINAMQQTASRMTWALAQDGGLFGAKYLASIHPKLDVPVWSLVANAVVVLILGCIYLGSSVAFNAIIGCSIILQMISYCVPILLLMMPGKREECLPANRAFKVPKWVGLGANTVVVGFTVIEVVFFVFPPAIPVTRSSMNYASVVLVVLFIVAWINWFVYAKSHYNGPRIVLHGTTNPSVQSC